MTAPKSLADELFAAGYEFDFFQAVRVLEAVYADRLPPTLDPVDRLATALRVRSHPSLAFPASSVHAVGRPGAWDGERSDAGQAPVPAVTITFFGLIGANGTLPLEYTELICRLRTDAGVPAAERTALREWFDLFNHRLEVFLYAAWEKYRFPVQFARYVRLRGPAGGGAAPARPGAGPAPDPFTRSVLSLVGLGTPAARNRIRVDPPGADADVADRPPPLARVDDLALLHYAGLLARRPPTAAGLGILLGDYFGVGARVEELTGQWLTLTGSARTRLTREGGGQLGRNTLAGERVWDVSSRFRVVLGPLRYAEFVEFLPDPFPVPARKAFFLLSQLVRLYAGPEFDFEVQLALLGTEVPDCLIQEVAEEDLGVRLGWNTWLPRAVPADLVADVCLDGDPRTDPSRCQG